MYLSELTRRLCTQDLYSFVMQNKKKLIWTISKSHFLDFDPGSEEVVTSRTIRAVWKYIVKFGNLPLTATAVKNYVVTNPDHIKEFSRDEDGKDETVGTIEQLDLLQTWEPSVESIKGMDALVLLETVFSRVRGAWHNALANDYGKISNGLLAFKWREGNVNKEERGPAAAIRWLRSQWMQDYTDEAPVVDGMMHENMQVVRNTISSRMSDEASSGRFKLGIDHIDDCVIVGKNNLRFIGVVGKNGDGKTTLVNYIVYNWLTQGAHGLYMSMEHRPEETFESMAYLHSTHPDYNGYRLPTTADWQNREGVRAEDVNHILAIIDDIEERRNLSGLLEVKEFPVPDWDSIKDWLEMNHAKNKYDFLVIDYISKLNVAGDQRWRDKEIGNIITQIHKFSMNFDNNHGLIVISPIQVTKESYKEAMTREFKEGEGHYDQNAIRQYSEFGDTMDLILTVWSDQDMKIAPIKTIEVACVKKRRGAQPPVMRMVYSPRHRWVRL